MDESRTEQAKKIHEEITNFKADMLPEVQSILDGIETTFKKLAQAEEDQKARTAQMTTSLTASASVDVNHNASQMAELNKVMTESEEKHTQLMRQVSQMFLYDKAFS